MLAPREVGAIALSGSEAAEYLQGQVTNDVEAIAPGHGVYAALLERKARIQADMRVLRTEDGFLLLTDPDGFRASFRHLDMYRIGRDVEIADRSAETRLIGLIGPGIEGRTGIAPGPEFSHRETGLYGAACRSISAPLGDLPGLDLLCPAEEAGDLAESLTGAGVPEISPEAAEVLRVEAAMPAFGREITGERMPAEAGIVERAVSFTKGCYIGQEPVARLHHRGRPNRLLRSLRFDRPVASGEPLTLDQREVGTVTSAVLSPARGPIGLAILRREAEPGATLAVGDSGATAIVDDPDGAGGPG